MYVWVQQNACVSSAGGGKRRQQVSVVVGTTAGVRVPAIVHPVVDEKNPRLMTNASLARRPHTRVSCVTHTRARAEITLNYTDIPVPRDNNRVLLVCRVLLRLSYNNVII